LVDAEDGEKRFLDSDNLIRNQREHQYNSTRRGLKILEERYEPTSYIL